MEQTNNIFTIDESLIQIDNFKDTNQSHIPAFIGIMSYFVIQKFIPDNCYETPEAGLKFTVIKREIKESKTKNGINSREAITYKKDEPIITYETMTKEKYEEKEKKSKSKPPTKPRMKKDGTEIVTVPKKEIKGIEEIEIDDVKYVKITYSVKRSKFITSIIKDVKNLWMIMQNYYCEDLAKFCSEKEDFETLVSSRGVFSKYVNDVSKFVSKDFYESSCFPEFSTRIQEEFDDKFGKFTGGCDKPYAKIKNASTIFKSTAKMVFTDFFSVIITDMLIYRCGHGVSLSKELLFSVLYSYFIKNKYTFLFNDFRSAAEKISAYVCLKSKKVSIKKKVESSATETSVSGDLNDNDDEDVDVFDT